VKADHTATTVISTNFESSESTELICCSTNLARTAVHWGSFVHPVSYTRDMTQGWVPRTVGRQRDRAVTLDKAGRTLTMQWAGNETTVLIRSDIGQATLDLTPRPLSSHRDNYSTALCYRDRL